MDERINMYYGLNTGFIYFTRRGKEIGFLVIGEEAIRESAIPIEDKYFASLPYSYEYIGTL